MTEPEKGAPGAPDASKPIIGLNGQPAAVPKRPWFALMNDDGTLATDDDGRLIRVRRR